MKEIKAKWDIDCDGYYPYCTICGFEPYEYVRRHKGYLPDKCPNCNAEMSNTEFLNNLHRDHIKEEGKEGAKENKGRKSKKCFAIDFDGTLVVNDNYPKIGKPNWPVVNKVKQLQKDGHEICLWTCRTGNDLDVAVKFCKEKLDLNFDDILINTNKLANHYNVSPCKLAADYYVDDRALNINDFLSKTDFDSGNSVNSVMLKK